MNTLSSIAFLLFSLLYLQFGESFDCGWQANDKKCTLNRCCSSLGFCGYSIKHCGIGCQSGNCLTKGMLRSTGIQPKKFLKPPATKSEVSILEEMKKLQEEWSKKYNSSPSEEKKEIKEPKIVDASTKDESKAKEVANKKVETNPLKSEDFDDGVEVIDEEMLTKEQWEVLKQLFQKFSDDDDGYEVISHNDI